jgi:hypothetical protein
MENNINDNNINFNVTGHTKIWHKQAGKVYEDPRGELIKDEPNEIMGSLRDYLSSRLRSNEIDASLRTLVTSVSDANLNLNIIDNNSFVEGKDCIIIGNAAPASSNSVVYGTNTSSVGVGSIGALTGAKFTGVFTKTTSGSFNVLSAGIGNSVVGAPIPGAINSFFNKAYARQSISRTLQQNDTLTIEWTITIG